jgi:hypothetical protein
VQCSTNLKLESIQYDRGAVRQPLRPIAGDSVVGREKESFKGLLVRAGLSRECGQMAPLQLECPATFHPQQQQERRMGTLQMWHRRIGLRMVVVATEIA